MSPEDLTELYEYAYREGKEINRGRCVSLITQRINELRGLKKDTKDELEVARYDNEMEDLELLRKRV